MSAKRMDVEVRNEGTIFLFIPLTPKASAWIDENVQAEDWQWFGNGLAVEHRYAGDLAQGMVAAGLAVR